MPQDYRIVEGGLGYILYWFDGSKWQWVLDSVDKADCLEYAWRNGRVNW